MTFSVIPWIDSCDSLGIGVVGATGERKAIPFESRFLEPDREDFSKGSTLTFETTVAKTANDVLQHFQVSASANIDATFTGYGGSADVLTKKIQDLTNSTSCVHLLSSGVKQYAVSYIKERNLLWDDEKLLQDRHSMTSLDFVKKYGDCFISGVVKGAYFHAVLTVRTGSQERTQDVTTSLNVAANYMGTEASFKSNSKDVLKEIANTYDMEINVYFSGVSEMQLIISIDDLAEKMGEFCQKATPEAAFPTYAILQEYCALPHFGGFSTDHSKLSSLFKQHEISSKVDLIYEYLRVIKLLEDVCDNPDEYVPACAIHCSDSHSFSADWMRAEFDGIWMNLLDTLKASRRAIETYLADPENEQKLPVLRPLWRLGIVEEELPITKAKAKTMLFGVRHLVFNEAQRIDFPIEMSGVPKIFKGSRAHQAFVQPPLHVKITDVSSTGFTATWTNSIKPNVGSQEWLEFSYIARHCVSDDKENFTVTSHQQVCRN